MKSKIVVSLILAIVLGIAYSSIVVACSCPIKIVDTEILSSNFSAIRITIENISEYEVQGLGFKWTASYSSMGAISLQVDIELWPDNILPGEQYTIDLDSGNYPIIDFWFTFVSFDECIWIHPRELKE